mgnify:FL=1
MSSQFPQAPISSRFIEQSWPAFVDLVEKRLKAGVGTYGDASFKRTPEALIEEIQQERRDVAGWAAIMHSRLDSLRSIVRLMVEM